MLFWIRETLTRTGIFIIPTHGLPQIAAVAANTAKVGITTQQASDITANNAKVGITPTQASEITANTAKVGITQTQADDITANNAKTGITAQQATDITTNNAKVGVIAGGTTGQALVKASGADYDTEWADICNRDTQYHESLCKRMRRLSEAVQRIR